MSLFPELEGLTLHELITCFTGEYRCHGDLAERDLWFQEVAIEIAKRGDDGFIFLTKMMPNTDKHQVRAILLSLVFLPPAVIEDNKEYLKRIFVSYIDSNDPMLTAEAIDGLNALGLADVLHIVFPLLNHQSPYVVGSVLRYMSRHYPVKAKPILLQSLESHEPIVRQNAVDELEDIGGMDVVPHLRPLLEDKDHDVRQAARSAIINLLQEDK